MLIDGAWTDGTSGRREEIRNPATDTVIGTVPLASAQDLDRALAAADAGFRRWRDTPVDARSRILHQAAARLRERAPGIARNMTREQGKHYKEALGEVTRVADMISWDAEEGRRAYGRVVPMDNDTELTIIRQPVGPVAAFTPWNFPAGSPTRKIAAALAAGCSIVIKASEEVPATACAIAHCFQDAGLPAGVLNLVFGVPAEVSSHLIPSPVVRFVAFTGSIPVGKQLAAMAASHMKPHMMELGGHAPVIVCADADPVQAARACIAGKIVNAGQVCTSPSRFFVHDAIHDRFLAELVKAAGEVVVGDGLDEGTTMGPLISHRRLQAVAQLVDDARAGGATVVCGGERMDRPGHFYPPTILTDLSPQARVLHEEPFGPLLPVLRFSDLDDAIEQANALPYGLAAYAFTKSATNASRLKRRFEAGILSINHTGGSVHQAPSGGWKESGYGREGGPEGLDGYLITKRVLHKIL
ncbi:NAD-dependent succinate-semialdehyde dehydrogenase [Pigmentiphaga humi]|nr:NAD-dependent succinate-semialdehyde dehydrogenase [Pigmentiphaga humi]